jgi:hypothetical protein
MQRGGDGFDRRFLLLATGEEQRQRERRGDENGRNDSDATHG